VLLAAISALWGPVVCARWLRERLRQEGPNAAEPKARSWEGKGSACSAMRAVSAVQRRLRRAVLRCVVPEAPGIVPVPSSVHAVVTCVHRKYYLRYCTGNLEVPTAICPTPSVRRPRHNRTADTLCERRYRDPGKRSTRAAWDARTHARLHARRRYADEMAKVKGSPPAEAAARLCCCLLFLSKAGLSAGPARLRAVYLLVRFVPV